MGYTDPEPARPQPLPPEPATSDEGDNRRRVIFWVVLVAIAGGILALALSTREERITSEDNSAYSIKFPKDFEKAKSIKGSLAIVKKQGNVTVIVRGRSNKPPLSIKDATKRLHNLSCGAKPKVETVNGQKAVTAIAPQPCDLFSGTAIVYGPTQRASLACSANHKAQVRVACRQVAASLKVK